MKGCVVGNVALGGDARLAVIAGPCLAESEELCVSVARHMREICARHGLGYVFKASFDKANRSSLGSDRGPGLDRGLEILAGVRERVGVAVTTDIHEPQQAGRVGAVVDLIQIPAFLSRQTDLLVAAAQTGRAVNVKKGQFMAPAEMRAVVGKLNAAGGNGIVLTERGTFFGYGRLVNDFLGFGDLLDLGHPVCFDATHSTQQPGATDDAGRVVSGGRPERSPLLARCAVAAGAHAVFLETHPDPSQARSDGPSMVPLDRMDGVLSELARVRSAVV